MIEVLLVDDMENHTRDLEKCLLEKNADELRDVKWHHARNRKDAEAILDSRAIDVVITDNNLKSGGGPEGGIDIIEKAKTVNPGLLAILVTAHGLGEGYKYARRLAGLGVTLVYEKGGPNYEEKDIPEMRDRIRERLRDEKYVCALTGMIMGDEAYWPELREVIEEAASSNLPVLIVGDTGTGKDVVARAIHNRSLRKNRKFLPVNLGTLSTGMAQSELHGHRAGTFTDGKQNRKGILASAEDGTVFFDEICDMPIELQVLLLRTLEQRRIRATGADEEDVLFEARVIAATNKSPEKEISENRFREDLFRRLDGIRINLLPLCERPGDIMPLARHFLKELAWPDARFSPEAEKLMVETCRWPGNIRVLSVKMERLRDWARRVSLPVGTVITEAMLVRIMNDILPLQHKQSKSGCMVKMVDERPPARPSTAEDKAEPAVHKTELQPASYEKGAKLEGAEEKIKSARALWARLSSNPLDKCKLCETPSKLEKKYGKEIVIVILHYAVQKSWYHYPSDDDCKGWFDTKNTNLRTYLQKHKLNLNKMIDLMKQHPDDWEYRLLP